LRLRALDPGDQVPHDRRSALRARGGDEIRLGIAVGLGGVGGATALTMTWKLPLAVWPTASVAVQVTVVLPTAKLEPEAGKQATQLGDRLGAARCRHLLKVEITRDLDREDRDHRGDMQELQERPGGHAPHCTRGILGLAASCLP
jgi:hypothetical protein